MGADEKLARKMKRYRSTLAHYKRLAKEAERDFKAGHVSKKRKEKLVDKYNAKKNKIILKMKKLKAQQR